MSRGRSPKGSPKGSREVRKSESPEDSLKPEVESPKLDESNSAIDIPQSEIEKPLTTHNSLLTNMEVHHHPEVEKKGLKEYLLEGLMIFIAVMMGFFAESLREYNTENNRAKEYAVTLYSDLKADTAALDGYLTYFKNAKANVDTLMQLLGSADPEKVPSGKLYWFGLFGGAYHVYTQNDATLLEMKNSGSLRFFGDKVIKRKLALYDAFCQNMKTSEDKENGIYTEVRKTRAHLFAFKYNDLLNNISHIKNLKKQRAEIDSFQQTKPPLLSYDKATFNEYVELVRSRFFDRKVMMADSLLRQANELIGLLNKKYDLQDE
ncbi:MAG: hypothetical protein ACHQIM_12375 [Sphingobacteriales bacterium]